MYWHIAQVGEAAMTEDIYMIAITALLPLMAVLLVMQTNPYQALVIRGILGAIAALVYVLFGAADVTLTEALVGTMLSITLYAVAVRSSMIMRVGIIETADRAAGEASEEVDYLSTVEKLQLELSQILDKYHVRIEICPYADRSALTAALKTREIHASLVSPDLLNIRVQRLYNILQSGLLSTVNLAYLD